MASSYASVWLQQETRMDMFEYQGPFGLVSFESFGGPQAHTQMEEGLPVVLGRYLDLVVEKQNQRSTVQVVLAIVGREGKQTENHQCS